MSSCFGNYIKLSLFGQSHGTAIGITIDNFPAGVTIDLNAVKKEMSRRAPGKNPFSTPRNEPDIPEILSGVMPSTNDKQVVTTGQPVCAVIKNTNQHSGDYGDGVDLLRPGHADYTGHVRYYGFEDWRGGGHFSGRLTAPIVFAGTLCSQYLFQKGIQIFSHIKALGTVEGSVIEDVGFCSSDNFGDFAKLKGMTLPVLDTSLSSKMEQAINNARNAGNSVGGIIECIITGCEAGLGAPFFDSVESILSHLMFSIPAVKGIEFGDGFGFAGMSGKSSNDEMYIKQENGVKKVGFSSNHSGGINGGITNGMPIIFRIAVRATPSVGQKQKTISVKAMEDAEIEIKGRHDPCILPRAIPVCEAMAAIGIMELVKEREACR